jgi:hypothetical protein
MSTPDLISLATSACSEGDLHLRNDLGEPGWMFWELRNLNRHRVVGFLKGHRQFADTRDVESEIRGAVSRNFKCSWWRGMAYGVVADVPAISLTPADLKILVDIRENSKGTLQWVILAAGTAHAAIGVHTWMEAYLSPVYRATLERLSRAGYRVAHARKEKDGLMKFLTGVADMNAAVRSFGTRKEAFPEFRDLT